MSDDVAEIEFMLLGGPCDTSAEGVDFHNFSWEQANNDLMMQAHKALPQVDRATAQFAWYQPLTAAFLHAGPMHLIGNLIFLLLFGNRINALIGNVGMAALYPVLAYLAGIFGLLLSPSDEPIAGLGASGAIAALGGAYLLFFPTVKMHVAFWWRIVWSLVVIAPFVFAGLIYTIGCMVLFAPLLLIFIMPMIWRALQIYWGGTFAVMGFWPVLLMFGKDFIYTYLQHEDGVAYNVHAAGFTAGFLIALGLLVGRVFHSRGADLLSVTLGRKAWPVLGKPIRYKEEMDAEAEQRRQRELALQATAGTGLNPTTGEQAQPTPSLRMPNPYARTGNPS